MCAPVRTVVAALVASAVLGACFGCSGTTPPDPRFATPAKTVETLLGAYGLDGVSQHEIQRRLRARQPFRLSDAAAYHACFTEFDGEASEAYAGFVVGALAAGREDIRVTIIDDVANVYPTPRVRVVMKRTETGWKIDLEQSVPAEIRAQFRDIARRAAKAHH